MEREWKPDTIVVEMSPACPRCGSSNTKFCYYNNYSLTQPRYFCKACRRYWTKGGSLRNVPVGGGCRKSRRGKSIRGPAARVPPRQGIEPSTKSNSPSTSYPSASPTIDLAAVYANFLNQNHTPQVENRIIDEPRCQIAIPSPSGFPDFQGLDLSQINNHPPQLSTAGLNFLDHDFTETRLFEDNGNAIYYQGFDDFKFNPQKQLAGANDGEDDNNCTSVVFNSMENNEALAALPPLPGEEMVAPAEILWADEILPPSGSFAGSVGAGPGANDEVVGEEVSPFSALSLEAIFRS